MATTLLTRSPLHRSRCHELGKFCVRDLSSGQVFTALKPFFFAVHPDLFGQFPREREINENSLKQLNAYIESATSERRISPTNLTFYLRNRQTESESAEPRVTKTTATASVKFQAVQIDLISRDVRRTVLGILEKCNLPTSYLDNIPSQPSPPSKQPFSGFKPFNGVRADLWEDFRDMNAEEANASVRSQKLHPLDLSSWLDKHIEEAKQKQEDCWAVREEISKLRKSIRDRMELVDILWDCGWGTPHFKGCLKSFQELANHHPDVMPVLKGRKLIFGRETGVSFDGNVILNSGEVRTNWYDLINNVRKYDALIVRIPSVQMALSRTLRDINVVHRKFGPKRMAEAYESLLRKLTTSMNDYLGKNKYPSSWPEKLSHLELVVESDAGPLMVSPTGQIIVPAGCPPFLLVNFITNSMEEAREKLEQYKRQKYEEKELHASCIKEFSLLGLQKDDNVTPNLMIDCLKRLSAGDFGDKLKGTYLWITTYYSVLSDGQICIPWNWKSDNTL